ncbi:MAG: Secretion system C-terminal sorting domain [Bacteroidota bacterium]|jgi:hypothetical protein
MRKILVTSFFLCAINLLKAQTGLFVMSSVGAMAGTSSNGLAINFNSIAACIDVQTGIAVLNGARGNGQFAINCEVTMKFNSLGIKMFPNPVNNATKVKFKNTPPLNDLFNLTIWTTEGLLVKSQKETGYNLFQGLNMDLSALIAGTYVLKIESAGYMDAIKFIKTN